MNGDVHGPSLFSFCMFFIIYLPSDEDLDNLITRFRAQDYKMDIYFHPKLKKEEKRKLKFKHD